MQAAALKDFMSAPTERFPNHCAILSSTMTNEARRTLIVGAVAAILSVVCAGGRVSGQAAPSGPAAYEDVATRIVQKGLRELGAYTTLAKLLSVGPRLTGSAQADAAVRADGRPHEGARLRQRPHRADDGRPLGARHARGRADRLDGARRDSRQGPRDRQQHRHAGRGLTAGAHRGPLGRGARRRSATRRAAASCSSTARWTRRCSTRFAAYGGAAQQRSGGAVAAAKVGAVAAVGSVAHARVRRRPAHRDDELRPGDAEDSGGHDLDARRRAAQRAAAQGARRRGSASRRRARCCRP